jgi:FtsH-binding integral membrane protein
MTKIDSTIVDSSALEAAAIVRPTYAPAALAMGVTMTAWGLLTHWSMSVLGAALAIAALGAWINDIMHSQESNT